MGYQKAYSYRRPPGGGGPGGLVRFFGPITDMVKYLLIANVAIFALSIFMPPRGPLVLDYLTRFLALVPLKVAPGLQVWRVATYMFAHANVSHILFNMLTLWWFGSPLETIWGKKKFLIYYLACGLGAGLACIPFYILWGQGDVPIMGASGSLFGLLVAFALIYPNARIYLMFLIPIKAKYLVIFWMVMEFMSTASYGGGGGGGGVANVAHLAGGLVGYFYLRRLMDLKYYWLRFQLRKKQRAYRVIDGGRDDNSPPDPAPDPAPSRDDDRPGPWLH